MSVFIADFAQKSHGLHAAILAAGGEIARTPDECSALLVDYPVPWHGNRCALVEHVAVRGGRVFEYPHGGPPTMQYDGLAPPNEHVAACLVPAVGHKELLTRVGYPAPVEVTGWHLCEQKPFASPERVAHVLFAPSHPWADGRTQSVSFWTDVNTRVYRALLELDVPVKTVRFFGALAPNGITPEVGVTLTRTSLIDFADQLRQIDAADVVVASGTFAYLAVARGKPTIMVGEDWPVGNDDYSDVCHHYDDWHPLIRYPVDVDDGPLPDLIDRAVAGGPEFDSWRDRFIGQPLDPARLLNILEG